MKGALNWLKKIFIPHEHNEFKPHFLRHESILLIGFLVIMIELAFLVQVFVVFDKTKFLASVLPGVLTNLTNEEREDLNLAPLRENPLLVRAAELKAQDMAEKGYFAHTSPEGRTPWSWLSDVGYAYKYAGENLAVNFYESSDVSRAWMNSPTHRANIVKPVYTEIGIGIATGMYQGKRTTFVAQFFGTPFASAQTTSVPVPESTPTAEIKTAIVEEPTRTTEPTTPRVATNTATSRPVLRPEPATTLIEIENIPEVATTILGEEAIVETAPLPKADASLAAKIRDLLSSPLRSVTYTYGVIALAVVFALLMVLFVRSELAHPAMIAKGFSLLVVIIILLIANTKIFYSRTLVPVEFSANAIEAYQELEFAE